MHRGLERVGTGDGYRCLEGEDGWTDFLCLMELVKKNKEGCISAESENWKDFFSKGGLGLGGVAGCELARNLTHES